MSKNGKVMDLKKVEALANLLIPTTPQEIQVFNLGWHNFIGASSKTSLQSSHQSLSCTKFLKSLNGLKSAKMLGRRRKTSMYKPLF
jgi:hypothetical protein